MKNYCFVVEKLDKINAFVQQALGCFHVAAIKSPEFACSYLPRIKISQQERLLADLFISQEALGSHSLLSDSCHYGNRGFNDVLLYLSILLPLFWDWPIGLILSLLGLSLGL